LKTSRAKPIVKRIAIRKCLRKVLLARNRRKFICWK